MVEKLMDIKGLEEEMRKKGISMLDAKDGINIMMLDIPKRIIDRENGLILYVVLVRPVMDIETGEIGDVKYVILDEQTVIGMKGQIERVERMKESLVGYV